jgi:DNA-binding SARP family transcriptional activator/tetratricopeptide (TPR) repeat protein
VQIRLLGAVDVVAADGPRPVPGLRRKALLAALALNSGEVVSTGRLMDIVWGTAAPATAASTLQNHVSYLRGLLGDKAAVRAHPPGYVLDLGADATDVQCARRLLSQGTQAADPVHGARQLREALALWRGRPLADLVDLAGRGWLEEQAEYLGSLRLQVKRALAAAGLAAGEHAQVVPDLELMAAEYVLDEQIYAQLMLALYRCGRQADALTAYQRLRRALGEELGISPSNSLRELEVAILRQDPALDPPQAAAVVHRAPALAPIPAQLPSAVPFFTGRMTELAMLGELLSQHRGHGGRQPATVVISAVSGTAGVGKTALAVHWAHRVAGEFPDGQLYVNLLGYEPGGSPADPGEAVRGFLAALGIPATRIPPGLAAQTALYRSLLAGRRILVVLDNARDAEQVRPLLPGSPGCLAIVTSRDRLGGLVAAEGAHPLTIDLLTASQARDLLIRRLGADRVTREAQAVAEIIESCARLPLALSIAAARAAISPGLSLAVIAAELREAAKPLDPFGSGDRATDVRAVFDGSYRALDGAAARLFRLLGLLSGPDFSVCAAASLAAVPKDRAGLLLTALISAHLVAEPRPGRYALHDLLRAYAAEQAGTQECAADRADAVRRVIDHYLHTSHHAALLLHPTIDRTALDPPRPGAIVAEPATPREALGWFMTEQVALGAAVRLAASAGASARSWQLAWGLATFLLRRGLWEDQAVTWNTALDCARRAGDLAGQAHALHGLAIGRLHAGRLHESGPLFLDARRLYETVADPAGQASVCHGLQVLAERQGHSADMLRYAMRALELYTAAGHQAGQAGALNNVGYSYALLGDYQRALDYCQQALAATQRLGERCWEAGTWHSLGYIHHKLGHCRRAIACYEQSLQMCRELADRYNEADTLDHLGNVHAAEGDAGSAHRVWTEALRIFEDIDHPAADPVRAKLVEACIA